VTVPGVRVRSKNAGAEDTSYTILIDEIPVASGSVPIGVQYTPAPLSALLDLGISEKGLHPDPQPVTGAPGCWVDATHWNVVRDAQVPLWQPVQYAIHHLEGVVRRNLAVFYGVQEAQTALDSWKRDAAGDSDIEAALSHLPMRLRLMRVLRSLVADRVPITAGAKVLRAIIGPGKENLTGDEMVRAVRLQFKELLPGNEVTARRIRLDEHWEHQLAARVTRTGDTSTLEVPPVEAHRLVGEVRNLLNGTSARSVLVTASTELRPLIQRFLQRDFPDLLVLAEEELVSVEESSARGSQQSRPGETATTS
jgi:type III secretory pathway component EscV